MPRKNLNKLTKRSVDALRVEGKDAIFWDRDLPGFGVRVYPTGRKVYVVQSRGPTGPTGPTGPKRATIGRHGAVSPDQARKQATVIIDRIKRGEDPVPPPPRRELSVADLAERYLRAHVQVNCRASTAAGYRRIVTQYIVPELGECPIAAVNRAQVAALHYRHRDTAVSGQPGRGGAREDVPSGRGLGADAAAQEPVPVGAPVQGTAARAISHARGVPAIGPGAGRGASRWLGPARGHGRAAPVAADRLPAQ